VSTDEASAAPIERLVAARGAFLAFVRGRVADPELAEDIVQDALLRAVRSLDELRDDDRIVPWFYRILRNGIVDAYRRRSVRDGRTLTLDDNVDVPDQAAEAESSALCACFRSLLPTLSPEYAEVIESDLAEEPTAAAAKRLAITPNNLKVRRHRARQALRRRLEEACRVCAEHGCLDCTCPAAPAAETGAVGPDV
jgi:RNA polymerase sigma-70 factor (ECF subfamily)